MLPEPCASRRFGKINVERRPFRKVLLVRLLPLEEKLVVVGVLGSRGQFTIRIAQHDTGLEDADQFDALAEHLLCEFARGAIRIFVRMDVPGSAGAVPSPFSVIVFAPGLPVEIQNKTVNGDSLCAIAGNDLRNLRLRRSPLAVHKAKRPLGHHRRVPADVGHAFENRLWVTYDRKVLNIATRAAAELEHAVRDIALAAI